MLPTFVIGLREGLEAALIVGIIAAFLRQQGRKDLLRWVAGGVGIAVAICVAGGFALKVVLNELPQKEQEGLETVIGVIAVAMVTYMVVWMKRNSRDLKGQLEGMAAQAMGTDGNAGRAMVAMAFLAVFREGFETVFFAIAIFDNDTVDTSSAAWGLFLGIALAVLLGYGIYRGGVRINLSKFFRATGLVLVLVAAGLVVNALHTAHEAGWLNAGQGRTVDLSWLVSPGSVRESLLTGMLGLQPHPVTIEVIGWLAFLIPVGLFVVWPPARAVPLRAATFGGATVALLAGLAALVSVVAAPSGPTGSALDGATSAGRVSATVVSRSGDGAVVRASRVEPVAGFVGEPTDYRLTGRGSEQHAGGEYVRYTATPITGSVTGRPATLTQAQAAALNGGRLPIGVRATAPTLGATYAERTTLTVWLDPRSGRLVDASWSGSVTATLRDGVRVYPLDEPVQTRTVALTAASRSAAVIAAASARTDLDRRATLHALAGWLLALAVAALLVAAAAALALRRRPRAVRTPTPPRPLVPSKA